MTEIDVSIAAPHERGVIENLMQFYIHDFSEFWWDKPIGELEPDGRFAPYPLDAWWRDEGHIPLLFRRDGNLAGFALLNRESHSGLPADRNMAEFFIVRKHRRGGVGSAAMAAIVALYPGLWEAAVARRNIAALPFWRQVAARHAEAEELDLDNPAWNGPILRFRAAG